MLDPSNGCQLRCPGCVHSDNQAWSKEFDWPLGVIDGPGAIEFLDQFGVPAIATVLSNYGEPLLNKRLPEIVLAAKRLLMFTMLSTNLSVRFDCDALVESGIDYMTLSIDGTSQDSYERYRRRGQLDLVLDNIRALVEAKRRLGRDKPYLVWQFLTFQHNVHEVESAIETGRQLGVNEVLIATPFSVDLDDPSIEVATDEPQRRIVLNPLNTFSQTDTDLAAVRSSADLIESWFDKTWTQRYFEADGSAESSRSEQPTCHWLYHNLTMDATKRLLPCCMAPSSDPTFRNVVFGNFSGSAQDAINTPMANLARTAFRDRAEYEREIERSGAGGTPYCANCTEKPGSPFGFDLESYVRGLDQCQALPPETYEALARCSLSARTG
jgi:pyruvate-formate lyase-activating enzyme